MKMQKRDGIIILIMLIIFLIPFKKIINQGFIVDNDTFISFAKSDYGFWIIFLIIILLITLILKKIIFWQSLTKFERNEERKVVSDDYFILFYFLGWFVYAIPLMFRGDLDFSKSLFNAYLYLTILSVPYVVLIKLSHLVKYLKNKEEIQKLKLFNMGNKEIIKEILIVALISIFFAFIIGFFIPEFPEGMFTTKEGSELALFMIFVSIPVEEIIFRGLILDFFIIFFNELFYSISKIPREKRILKLKNNVYIENYAWLFAIIVSGFIFALYHLDRYGYDIFTMIYLFILASAMGLARKIGGLSCAYLIHLINNLFSIGFAMIIIPNLIQGNSFIYFPFFIIINTFIYFLYLKFNKQISREV